MRYARALAVSVAVAAVVLVSSPAAEAHSDGPTAAAPAATAAKDTGLPFYGVGDGSGYHVYRAPQGDGGTWHELATIRPGNLSGDAWLGYQCVTSTGRYVVAVVAPRRAANDHALGNAGGFAYAIDTTSGAVRPLASGVALKYHSPGCGVGNEVALPSYSGPEGVTTNLRVFDAATGEQTSEAQLDVHVTSAVPTDEGAVAADGRSVVTIEAGRIVARQRAAGVVYKIRRRPRGVVFLARVSNRRTMVQELAGKRLRTLTSGRLHRTELLDAGSDAFLVGAGRPKRAAGGRLRRMAWPSGLIDVVSVAASGDHETLVGQKAESKPEVRGHGHTVVAELPRVSPILVSDRAVERKRLVLPRETMTPVVTKIAAPPGKARERGLLGNTTTPKCAVPRNDLRRQVPQPSTTQVNWAIQQAIRGNLKGSVLTRPANFLNMNLVSYQPSNDFAPVALSGGGQIPPSVAQAIYAQETNWKQASFHALPGVSGNPLVSDYYGAGGSLDAIDYDKADCGYGVSQVTDPMSVSAPQYSANGKTKVGVDYAENVAAGLQILADKWNQLKNAGVTVNGGNPAYLENWYFAIWAYNSGFHAPGTTRWGLGWTNNPQNADYDPSRLGFLRSTYADASHPADWPYQERVIGFMESPLLNYKGAASYAKPSHGAAGTNFLTLPAHDAFCAPAPLGNECSPSYNDPVDPGKSYCTRTDRECWWHSAVTFANCASDCTTSSFTYAATAGEPAGDNNYPPACDSTLPPGTIIVDDQPSNLNVEGCGTGNWSNAGSFAIAHGSSGGVAVGAIDWHQIGAGFGGHTYFTHNRAAGDAAHTEVGTWTPTGVTSGRYNVSVHIPSSGASSEAVQYTIHRGDGTTATRTVNQHLHENRWIALGTFTLLPGAKVVLANSTTATSGSTNVAYDAVGFTKVTSTQPTQPAAQLAQDFRPALFFDSSEKWRPLNVGEFLTELRPDGQPAQARCIDSRDGATDGELGHDPYEAIVDRFELAGSDPTLGPDALCAPIHQEADLTKWRSARTFLLINRTTSSDVGDFTSPYPGCRVGSLYDCNGGEAGLSSKSALYYDIAETSGYTFLQYWMFYRYNSASDLTHLFNHQGDWEAVAVAPNADGDTFDFASFSGHGNWYSYLRSSLTCVDMTAGTCGTDDARVGKRVKVYVANGTHANYAFPCSEVAVGDCAQSAGAAPERGYDGQKAWGKNADSASVVPLPSPGTGGWNDWAGHWGASGSPIGDGSPRSPAVQPMYGKPWGSCAREQTDCALPQARSADRSALAASPAPGDPTEAPTRCSSWFGPGVNGVLCDASGLRRRVASGRLAEDRALQMRVVRSPTTRARAAKAGSTGDRAFAARVVAQSLGAPLAVGDSVRIAGSVPRGAELLVRAKRADGTLVELRSVTRRASGGLVLRVVRGTGGTLELRRD